MATNFRAVQPQTIINPTCRILTTDTTDLITFITAGASGALVKEIIVTNDDTNAVDIEIYMNDGSNDLLIGSYQIPVSAGKLGNPAIKLLNATGLGQIALEATNIIKVKATTTILADAVNFIGVAYDYVAE